MPSPVELAASERCRGDHDGWTIDEDTQELERSRRREVPHDIPHERVRDFVLTWPWSCVRYREIIHRRAFLHTFQYTWKPHLIPRLDYVMVL